VVGEEKERMTSAFLAFDIVQQEITSLKEQLQCVLRDNQILKKAVSLQHQKNLENEEKLKEVPQLKHIIGQYQEQIRTLEVT